MRRRNSFPFVDRELAQRLESAEAKSNAEFVDGRAQTFPDRAARWIEVSGAYCMFDGATSPLTQTFGLGMQAVPSSDDWDIVENFYAERDAPVYHEVSPHAGTELAAQLAERGYRPIEFSNVLLRPLDTALADRSPPSGLSVRAIECDEHELWAEIAHAGWQEYGDEIANFVLEVGEVNRSRPGALSYLAELDGKPIAAGSLNLQDGIALLAGASTVPAFRKRGAQNALLEFRLQHAASQGCDLAMVCTEPGSISQRNAERQGFQVAYTRTKWGKKFQ